MNVVRYFVGCVIALAAGCGSLPDQQSSSERSNELVTFEELKTDLKTAVERELAQLELDVGVLRSHADASDEDFTSELVHLDELMHELSAQVDEARVEDAADLESLTAETERRLQEINRKYTHLKMRVSAASEATDR